VQEDIETSKEMYKQFFERMCHMYTKRAGTYKGHSGGHIPDDVKHAGVHLDALSAYPFENEVRVITQVCTSYFIAKETSFR
jgi:hypothetical protein